MAIRIRELQSIVILKFLTGVKPMTDHSTIQEASVQSDGGVSNFRYGIAVGSAQLRRLAC
jgi:hypothetical protein